METELINVSSCFKWLTQTGGGGQGEHLNGRH